jgi:hypothetical protein
MRKAAMTDTPQATPRTDALIPSQSFVDETRLFDREWFVPLLEHARSLERALAAAERDAARLNALDSLWREGVHLEVCATGGPTWHALHATATLFVGAKEYKGTSVREVIDAALAGAQEEGR